jgi:outer membrane protein
MKKTLLLLLSGTMLLWGAEDLKMLLDATDQNELVGAYASQARSARLTHDAVRASYLPRIDLGANASFLDETGDIDVKESYTAYAKASVTLFDGFRRENMLDEKAALARSSDAELEGFRKDLALQVARSYFELMNLQGDIDAQMQRRNQLREQLERQKRFLEARIATDEEVERIRAAVANADYEIASLRYRAEEEKARLFNLSGIAITEPAPSRFVPPAYGETTEPDAIAAMRHQAAALQAAAQQSVASYYPNLSLEDSYSYYHYSGVPSAIPIERAEKQNRLMVLFSMNLVDFSAASKQREALLAEQLALEHRIAYESKRADTNVRLAVRSVERARALIQAAEQSLAASGKTLEAVTKKYRARVVDYVKYLDALYEHTDAIAQHNRARNTLQNAYAQYYYHAGYDLKEFLK